MLPLLLTLATPALAEGSDVLPSITVEEETVLGVDILDHTVERIRWEGQGSVRLTAPDGTDRGLLVDGDSYDPDQDGVWRVELTRDQLISWDLDVLDPVAPGGRVFSENWMLNARFYDERGAWSGTLYVRALDEGAGLDAVVAVRMDGWVGHRWQFLANSVGPTGAPTAGSFSEDDAAAAPEHRIYLDDPAAAAHTVPTPELLSAGFTQADGFNGGVFTIEAGGPGTAHIACDTDGDGATDPAGGTDLAWAVAVPAGTTEIEWDGAGPDGERWGGPIPDCGYWLATGEVHLLAVDIETAWPGIQLHQADSSGALSPLQMRWHDHAVAESAVPSPDGDVAATASGPDGVTAGDASAPIEAGAGARSWGDFTELSRGNVAILDTWAWLESDGLTIEGTDPSDWGEDTGEPEPEPDTADTGVVDDAPKDEPAGIESGYFGGACSAVPAPVGALAAWGGLLIVAARRRQR